MLGTCCPLSNPFKGFQTRPCLVLPIRRLPLLLPSPVGCRPATAAQLLVCTERAGLLVANNQCTSPTSSAVSALQCPAGAAYILRMIARAGAAALPRCCCGNAVTSNATKPSTNLIHLTESLHLLWFSTTRALAASKLATAGYHRVARCHTCVSLPSYWRTER